MNALPKVAVVTGGHNFNVPAFHTLFRSLPDADCYIQHLEDYGGNVGKVRQQYDVVLFYTMPRGVPPAEGGVCEALEELGATSQGVFVLHHGILTYGDWPFWSNLVGMQNREVASVHFDQTLNLYIERSDHPITSGLEGWSMVDETYVMAEPDADNEILLTTDHPQSLKAIAWTRTFQQARVFCFQAGHDHQTYVDPNFRQVLARGIQWCAGRL